MDPLEQAHYLALLYQRLGSVLWQLQELETTATTYVVVRLRKARGVGLERGRRIEAKAGRQTFGSLIRELRESGVIPEPLGGELAAIVKERNWIVHSSRRDNRGVLNRPAAYNALMQRLDDDAEAALALLKRLGSEVEEFVVESGVSQAQVDTEAAALLEEWGYE